MKIWELFRPKPTNYNEIFGEISGDSAKSFYESYFTHNDYKTVKVGLPEQIRLSLSYDFSNLESFEFPNRPIKQRDHWILGNHVELDTPTLIVDKEKKIKLEDVYLDGTHDRTFIAENFRALIEYIVIKSD